MRNDNVAVHTNRWVIKLEKESGEGGYFFAVGMEGEPLVSKHVNGLVQLFDSRDKAEKCTKWLRKV